MKSLKIAAMVFLILALAGGVFGWRVVQRGFSARNNPSAMEGIVARTARRLSYPASARDAKNPFTPTPHDLSEARAHFADHGAICHIHNGIRLTGMPAWGCPD